MNGNFYHLKEHEGCFEICGQARDVGSVEFPGQAEAPKKCVSCFVNPVNDVKCSLFPIFPLDPS